MPNTNADDGEVLISLLHEHWVKYVSMVLVYILLLLCSAIFFYVAGLVAYHTEWASQLLFLFALILVLLDHHWFFMAVLSQAENHIIITNRRVIWIRHLLFFDEEMHEYAFEKMKFVEGKKTTILQYVLGYGTLAFESGSPIPYVPHPNTAVRTIEQAMGLT